MFYKISDFAREIGVSSSTLRLWENKGILVPASKTPTGQRLYTQEQLDIYKSGDYNNPILKGKIGDNSVLRE